MKIHRRRVALLVALLTAIGLATLPLEGAAILLRYVPETPPPTAQSGEPDTPIGRAILAVPDISGLRALRFLLLPGSRAPLIWFAAPSAARAQLRGTRTASR
jgi:hypothetical protein